MKLFSRGIFCLMISFLSGPSFADVISKKLNDVVPAKGNGTINVFDIAGNAPDITSADIEAFRLDNEGSLVFAVDVNEAASGTEKSSSQGITIKTATIHAVISGQSYFFEEFWTQTETVVAEKGSTIRARYYTVIGDTGSSRITTNTSSDINGSDFDATLNVEVNMDLSLATTVELIVVFLDTNVSLGDPEAFYDYSNGFEDLAIVSKEDAVYLNGLASGQTEAPLVVSASDSDMAMASTQYFPSANEYVLSAFEDRYPSRGDYDFNDLVVAYRIWLNLNKYGKTVSIGGVGYLVAKGALYDLDWGLTLNLPLATGQIQTDVFDPDTGFAMPERATSNSFIGDYPMTLISQTKQLWLPVPGEYFINTEAHVETKPGHKFQFTMTFDSPQAIEVGPLDLLQPFIYVHPTSQTILNGMSFINDQGYPFGLVMPQSWIPPSEHNDIGQAYPDLVNYIKSGGNSSKSWYNNNNANFIAPIQLNVWQW